jgi:hypothetical protein
LAELRGAAFKLANERLIMRVDSRMIQKVVPSYKWADGAAQKRTLYLSINSFRSGIIKLED